MAADARLQFDINTLIGKLRKMDGAIQRDVKSDLKNAAAIIVTAIKASSPVGKKAHKRRNLVYKPGNLRKSIRVLPLRRTRGAVVVGPLSRGGTTDGYYAHMVEFGTIKMAAKPFIESAVESSYPGALTYAVTLLKHRVEKYAQANWYT